MFCYSWQVFVQTLKLWVPLQVIYSRTSLFLPLERLSCCLTWIFFTIVYFTYFFDSDSHSLCNSFLCTANLGNGVISGSNSILCMVSAFMIIHALFWMFFICFLKSSVHNWTVCSWNFPKLSRAERSLPVSSGLHVCLKKAPNDDCSLVSPRYCKLTSSL